MLLKRAKARRLFFVLFCFLFLFLFFVYLFLFFCFLFCFVFCFVCFVLFCFLFVCLFVFLVLFCFVFVFVFLKTIGSNNHFTPNSNWKQFQVFKIAKFEVNVTVYYILRAKCTQLWPLKSFVSLSVEIIISILNTIWLKAYYKIWRRETPSIFKNF